MSGLLTKGTKLFYADASQSFSDLAAHSYPTSPWVEAGCLDSLNENFTENTPQDDWCLGDLVKTKINDVQPGTVTFTINHVPEDISVLMVFANGLTQKKWAICFYDGSAWVFKGKLVLTSGTQEKGVGNRVTYQFTITMDELAVFHQAD